MGIIVDISEVLLPMGLSSPTAEERAIVDQEIYKAEGAVRRYLKYDPKQVARTEYYPRFDPMMEGRERVWEVNDTAAYLRTLAEASANELQVQHLPIRTITSLNVDYDGRFGTRAGSFGASTAWTEGTDFWPHYDGNDSSGNPFSRDGLIMSEGRWPNVGGSVKIVYTAGYTDDELRGRDSIVDASPIFDAIVDESIRRVKKQYNRRKHVAAGIGVGPITNESLGDYSYGTDAAAFTRLVGGGMDLMPETIHKLSEFVNMGLSLSGG